MKWLVCVNSEGVQCQVPTGTNTKKAAEELKVLLNRAKIKFAFEYKSGGHDPNSSDYETEKAFGQFLAELTRKIHEKYGAASPAEFTGYTMRKRYAMGDGIEVMADLDADNYEEFHKKYHGAQGGIDILDRTVKLMSPPVSDKDKAAKLIFKFRKKLEAEKEDED